MRSIEEPPPVAGGPADGAVALPRHDDGTVTIGVVGVLDGTAGGRLVDALAAAVAAGATRVDVDLLGVTTWDDEGAASLRAARDVRHGSTVLRFRTDAGPGHDALLRGYT